MSDGKHHQDRNSGESPRVREGVERHTKWLVETSSGKTSERQARSMAREHARRYEDGRGAKTEK